MPKGEKQPEGWDTFFHSAGLIGRLYLSQKRRQEPFLAVAATAAGGPGRTLFALHLLDTIKYVGEQRDQRGANTGKPSSKGSIDRLTAEPS